MPLTLRMSSEKTDLKKAHSAVIETEFYTAYEYDYQDLVRIGFSEVESLALMESNFDKNKAIFLLMN